MRFAPITSSSLSPEPLCLLATTISQFGPDLLFKDQLQSEQEREHTTSVYYNLTGTPDWASPATNTTYLTSGSVLLSPTFQWTMEELQSTKSQQKLRVWNKLALIIST